MNHHEMIQVIFVRVFEERALRSQYILRACLPGAEATLDHVPESLTIDVVIKKFCI